MPPSRKPFVMNYFGNMYSTLYQLGFLNSAVGMTLLVDSKGMKRLFVIVMITFQFSTVGRVRWRAVGPASPNELQYLTENIQKLLQEN